MTNKIFAAAVLAMIGCPARAHHFMDGDVPQTFMQGLLSGLGHPLIGLDHAAFIVTAGFLLALVRGGVWGIAALIIGSLCGAALHLAGVNLPGSEAGVAVSVILIGVLAMAQCRLPLSWLAGGLVFAGAFHGHAYAESIFGAEMSPLVAYLTGFSAMQFAVATAAFLLHRWLINQRQPWIRPVFSALGMITGAVGLVYLAINIAG